MIEVLDEELKQKNINEKIYYNNFSVFKDHPYFYDGLLQKKMTKRIDTKAGEASSQKPKRKMIKQKSSMGKSSNQNIKPKGILKLDSSLDMNLQSNKDQKSGVINHTNYSTETGAFATGTEGYLSDEARKIPKLKKVGSSRIPSAKTRMNKYDLHEGQDDVLDLGENVQSTGFIDTLNVPAKSYQTIPGNPRDQNSGNILIQVSKNTRYRPNSISYKNAGTITNHSLNFNLAKENMVNRK